MNIVKGADQTFSSSVSRGLSRRAGEFFAGEEEAPVECYLFYHGVGRNPIHF